MKTSSYMSIYHAVKTQINSGRLSVGERLPTEPELARHFGVSIGTLRKGIDQLVLEGLVKREQGRGTYVKQAGVAAVDDSESEDFIFGCALTMLEQDVLNRLIFRGDGFRQMSLPSPLNVNPELSQLWQGASLVQIPLSMFPSPELEAFLAPLPRQIVQKAEAQVPAHILSKCRTFDGQLRVMPLVVNPTVCYCWKPAFERAGVSLPSGDWTFEQFIDICRKLASANEKPAFGLMPFPGLVYELLLWGYGGDYYDADGMPWLPEQPFTAMMSFLRAMYREDLCFNPFGHAVTGKQCFTRPEFCVSFCGPIGVSHIDEVEQWHVCSVPGSATCAAVVGLGVPCNSPCPEKAFSMLERVGSVGSEGGDAGMQGEMPALENEIARWVAKQKVTGGDAFSCAVQACRLLDGRRGFERWWREVYSLFDDIARGRISIVDGREKVIAVLMRHRVRGGDVSFFL